MKFVMRSLEDHLDSRIDFRKGLMLGLKGSKDSRLQEKEGFDL